MDEYMNAGNTQPLISVIVPVYKVEKYLHRCVDSILNQTYKNLEIILVDDGSPDNCGAICDEYAAKDSRIRVIHQENRGLSEARNAGLDICTGEYIAFVDSDDYIMPEMYEKMLAALLEKDVDICVCQWQYERPDGQQVVDLGRVNADIYGIKSSEELAEWFYRGDYEGGVVCSVCIKLYKRKIFSAVRFYGRYVEDDRIHNQILSKQYSTVVIAEQLYIYCQNLDSLSNQPFGKNDLMYLDVLAERSDLFAENSFISFHTWKRYCDMYVEYYYKAQTVEIKMPDTVDFDRMFRKLLLERKCGLKFYIRMILFRISPKLYKYITSKK